MQTSKKTSPKFNLRLAIVCISLLIFVFGYWVYKAYLIEPSSVFYGMVLNSLNTRSYVVIDEQQSLSGSLIQQTLVEGDSVSKVISREKNTNTNSNESIQTLSIGTPSTDYSSYEKIDVGKASSSYKPILGAWGVNSPDGSNGQGGQLYKSSVSTPFLFSSPSSAQTAKLMNFIKLNKVYVIKTSKLKNVNGRPVINYSVNINLQEYSRLLRLYANIIGYKAWTKPIRYSDNQVAQLEISVDCLSRQLIGLSYVGSNAVQIYQSYGINAPIKIPTKVVTLAQLKDEISELSKQ